MSSAGSGPGASSGAGSRSRSGGNRGRTAAPWAVPLAVALLGAGAVALAWTGDRVPRPLVLVWAVLMALVALGLSRFLTSRVAGQPEPSDRPAADEGPAAGEARLLQAQKMEAVGRLAGGIAHDINNYLAGIRTHCELLLAAARRGTLDQEKAAARLEAVVGTVLKASSLIERLLTFGRRQPSLPEVVDLNEVVETFAAGLGGGLGAGVELATDLAPDLWPVEIDLSQAEQALANLVVNARDALAETPGGGGRIVVATANLPGTAGAPDRVCLRVTDDGPGIPEAIREHIFDPFFSTKETTGASGLGLATVYAVVDEAGGTIELDSRTAEECPELDSPGAPGTTFRIFLPRAERSAPRRARREPAATAGGGERILLVDDEDEVRAATRTLLAEHGYGVEAVGDAAAAVAAAAAARAAGAPFDLVVTDVRLGRDAGPDLVARLREQGALRALYMSGYTDRIALRTGPGRGDAFFLKKPFSGDGLLRMVRELLDSPAR